MKTKLFDRLKAAWTSFRDPSICLDGMSIQRITRDNIRYGEMAIVRHDPEVDFTVHALPHKDQAAIRNYLGW